ncbi:hypothetical protein [Paracoccus marcusii]|uniref:hypothetical protein n=1 Tax=Paracoccus marcusii TaxID=59779 RepID=UPI0037350358
MKLLNFGFRLVGGGTHQSKTMMLEELEGLLGTGYRTSEALKASVVDDNSLGKTTVSTRRLTYRHMSSLFGLVDQPVLTKVLFKLWSADREGHRLLALLVSLARDPILRDTATVVLMGSVGQNLQRPLFETALSSAHPNRFSEKMTRSLAQNCASTWTQSGHLLGAVRKVRQRVSPSPSAVALAALLATVAGFGGPSILSSMWMQVLDLSPDQAFDHLRRAEALGLARVRSAGEVTEIAIRQPMAATLGVRDLELV